MKWPSKLALLAVTALALGLVAMSSQPGGVEAAPTTPTAYGGACPSTVGEPAVTSVAVGSPVCVAFFLTGADNDLPFTLSTTSGTFTAAGCFPACGTPTGDGTASLDYDPSANSPFGQSGEATLTVTSCPTATLTVTLTQNSASSPLVLNCTVPAVTGLDITKTSSTGPDATLAEAFSYTITVSATNFNGNNVVVTDAVPAGLTVTSVTPGANCTQTQSFTCTFNGATGSTPIVITANVTAASCGATTNTANVDTNGVTGAEDSAQVAVNVGGCQGAAPEVGILVYPGTCAALPLPLPPTVTEVEPGMNYCISGVASDHVTGDTMTYTSAGVGTPTFNLNTCYTNSAAFNPCTDPGNGGTPYVIPLASEDANSFVGNETDFSFTSCSAANLTLTFRYDGPGLAPAQDTETIPCSEDEEPPAGEFRKYTDADDEVVAPGEVFTWYIDVPESSEFWSVSDLLPYGFKIVGDIEPRHSCWQIANGFTCYGRGATTIEVQVKAPQKCGEYTNKATLLTFRPRFDSDHAFDGVSVQGCSTPPPAPNPGGSNPGGSNPYGSPYASNPFAFLANLFANWGGWTSAQ